VHPSAGLTTLCRFRTETETAKLRTGARARVRHGKTAWVMAKRQKRIGPQGGTRRFLAAHGAPHPNERQGRTRWAAGRATRAALGTVLSPPHAAGAASTHAREYSV